MRWLAGSLVVSVVGLWTVVAPAQPPSVKQQADALVDNWFALDTPQNRQQKLETSAKVVPKVKIPTVGEIPVLENGRYPTFKPQERTGRLYSKLVTIPHYFYVDTRGPATLLITERGPAVRYYKGHYGQRVSFSGHVVSQKSEIDYSKPKALAPRWLPKKWGQAVAKWRAQRMMRSALKDGRVTAHQVKKALRRTKD
jgi:hypothetical protein